MITRLWSLTLLVSQLVLGFDHSIDLTRCKPGLSSKSDTACFIRESCFNDKSAEGDTKYPTWQKTLVQFNVKTDELKDGDCDAVIQIKVLNDKKFHVMMHIKKAEKLKKEDGLKLEQGGMVMFHCTPGAVTSLKSGVTVELTGNQIVKDNEFFCAFNALADQVWKDMNKNVNENPKLLYMKDGSNIEIELVGQPKQKMWFYTAELASSCAHDFFQSSRKDGGNGIELTEVDTTLSEITCDGGIVKIDQNGMMDASSVKCEMSDWIANVVPGGEKILAKENFNVYCPKLRCRLCTTAPPQVEGFDQAIFKKWDANPPEECSTLKCDNNKWTTTGTEIIVGTAECKRNTSDSTKFAWFLKKEQDSQEEELKQASCLDKLECLDRWKSTVEAGNSVTLVEGTDKIKCATEGQKMQLEFKDPPKGQENPTDNITLSAHCDTSTGKFRFTKITCTDDESKENNDPASAGMSIQTKGIIYGACGGLGALVFLFGTIFLIRSYDKWKEKKKKAAAPTTAASKKEKSTNNSTQSTAPPGEVVDGSEGKKKSSKSKKSKRDKLKLEDFPTWDNEQFTKKILPNFKTFDSDSKGKWVRNYLGRFYAYCNTKKTPESGTFNQFWLLVKQCADDKCEDAAVWMELWRCAFTIGYSITEKTDINDEVRRRIMMPFEKYMVEYIKKCDIYKRKDEPRGETEMRIICIEVLLHTRHPDATDTLRKLTFNEKLEVPLRMLTAACYTRERDEKPKTVEDQYKRVLEQSVLDPHIAEGWGTYLQHCCFGLGAYLITQQDVKQYKLFEELYQVTVAKDNSFPRKFSPSDWMYAYKGAVLHENSAKIAIEMFKKLNDDCLLHVDTLLKQKHPDDADEREKDREQYKKDMKEYTQLLADLLIGEDDFNDFKPHLRHVILFIGDLAKAGEPLSEERIRERAINMGNMVRDRDFAKGCNESLKAIGAKEN